MKVLVKGLLGAAALAGFSLPAYADTTLTIATVNNGNMIDMQKLTDDFTKANPDIKLNWVTLEENVLRQKVTTDIATKGGQFDVLTIGTYETPIWAKNGWLVALDNLGADYKIDDLLPAIRGGLSNDTHRRHHGPRPKAHPPNTDAREIEDFGNPLRHHDVDRQRRELNELLDESKVVEAGHKNSVSAGIDISLCTLCRFI